MDFRRDRIHFTEFMTINTIADHLCTTIGLGRKAFEEFIESLYDCFRSSVKEKLAVRLLRLLMSPPTNPLPSRLVPETLPTSRQATSTTRETTEVL